MTAHKHFPVNLLRTSPTAIGLMSGAQPGFNLLSAVKDPPAMKIRNLLGNFPRHKRLTTLLSREQIVVGSEMEAASNKCCTLRPEGPAAVPFGKD